MEIAFKTKALRSICSNKNALERKYGPEASAALRVCLVDLRAAECIVDVLSATQRDVPGFDSGHKALETDVGFQLVVTANHVDNPQLENGEVDWSSVTRIQIMSIEQDD